MKHPHLDLLELVFNRASEEFYYDQKSGHENVPTDLAVDELFRLVRDLLTLHLEVEQNIGIEEDEVDMNA